MNIKSLKLMGMIALGGMAFAGLQGCSQSSDSDSADVASADIDSGNNNTPSAGNGTPRLHPVEKVCIDYEMTGDFMNGTSQRCHRNFGYEQYEITNTEIGMAGMSQTQNQHTITIGETIYSINLQTNTGTQATNPFYADITNAMQTSNPEDMAASFIAAMGFTDTGEDKTIAEMNCDVYSSAQMGTACLTTNGLLLETIIMGMVQRATSVQLGNGGDNANYTAYQYVTINQAPDLSNGLDGLINQYGGQQ